jgi:hypothetical protein
MSNRQAEVGPGDILTAENPASHMTIDCPRGDPRTAIRRFLADFVYTHGLSPHRTTFCVTHVRLSHAPTSPLKERGLTVAEVSNRTGFYRLN